MTTSDSLQATSRLRIADHLRNVITLLIVTAPLSMVFTMLWSTLRNLIQSGVLFLPINDAWDFLIAPLLFGLLLIPALVFYRRPRIAVSLYVATSLFFANWWHHKVMERSSVEPRPYSERWFFDITNAVLLGCALLLAYWLLNKYSNRFKIRIV